MQVEGVLSWQRVAGDPIAVRGMRITPESLALMVRLPFAQYTWNYPIDVLVERDGEARRVPIIDVTRVARWALGLGLLMCMLAISSKRRRECE